MKKIICILLAVLTCVSVMTSCSTDDTYKLAKLMAQYEMLDDSKSSDEIYKKALKMAKKGNYDANCKDCFKGIDSSDISLFAYACSVDYEIAVAIYENGADIESSNRKFYRTPLLAALKGNRNNTEIVYWLIDEGADIDAISFDGECVFDYLRYWDDNADTRELIEYFKGNCDMEYLEKNSSNWNKLWDEDGEFVFYKK